MLCIKVPWHPWRCCVSLAEGHETAEKIGRAHICSQEWTSNHPPLTPTPTLPAPFPFCAVLVSLRAQKGLRTSPTPSPGMPALFGRTSEWAPADEGVFGKTFNEFSIFRVVSGGCFLDSTPAVSPRLGPWALPPGSPGEQSHSFWNGHQFTGVGRKWPRAGGQ